MVWVETGLQVEGQVAYFAFTGSLVLCVVSETIAEAESASSNNAFCPLAISNGDLVAFF